jgi:hypothetical protein
LLSFLQISNNLSEIKDAGDDAVNEACYNLGIADSSGFVGRSLGAPKLSMQTEPIRDQRWPVLQK